MFRIVELLALSVACAALGSSPRDSSGQNQAMSGEFGSRVQDAERASSPPPPGERPPGRPGDAAGTPERQGTPEQGPSGRDWRGERGGFRLSPESREHVLAVIADLRPLSDEERAQLADMSFEELRKVLAEQGGMILGLARLRETQPELYDLRIADMKLLRRIQAQLQIVRDARAAGEPGALATAESALHALVSEQIDLRFAIREREITALEERVAAMRQELDREREQPRDELITRRLQMFENGGDRDWRREGPRPDAGGDDRDGNAGTPDRQDDAGDSGGGSGQS